MDPASASSVAARARTENFPVASLLFPRAYRTHLRAIYGFARLVDILGDEYEGNRLQALDELEAEVGRCYEGDPTWGGVLGDPPPAVRRLPPAGRAVPAADRGEPDGSARLGVRHVGRPEALLRPLGRPRRAARARRARAGRARPGGALGRRLHGPAARQLPAGRAARPRTRARVPAGRGPRAPRRARARPPEPGAARAARVRGRPRPRAARERRGPR